jgi:hypothetical protein
MKLVVIGNGMVGQRLLEQLQTSLPKLEITVLSIDRASVSSCPNGRSLSTAGVAWWKQRVACTWNTIGRSWRRARILSCLLSHHR